MGMIAKAGLIGGIGKGIEKVADVAIKRDFAALEEARMIRLQQLDAQSRMQQQNTQIQASKELQASQQASQAQLAQADDERALTRTSVDNAARSADAAADRLSREKIAEADRLSAQKIANTRAAARPGAKPEKFTTNTIKASTLDAKGNISEIETLAVTRGGQTFIQLGKEFVPYQAGQPAAPVTARAPKAALSKLNASNAEQFLNLYGYLPANAIKYIGGEATATTATTDDEE